VQETFAQALKSFDRYEMGTNCRAWLCKIMFHKRSQWIRANSRFVRFGDGDEAEIAAPSSRSTVLPREFMSENLRLSLRALPKKYHQIIWLSEIEELTYREIAEQVNVPIGTVMSRLHRGRKMLRANFHFYAAGIHG
jgi:RNA polymerase sigma-70 factor (ECF subfamily)